MFINIHWKKRLDGVLGIQTRRRRLIGADETTELWWPPNFLLWFMSWDLPIVMFNPFLLHFDVKSLSVARGWVRSSGQGFFLHLYYLFSNYIQVTDCTWEDTGFIFALTALISRLWQLTLPVPSLASFPVFPSFLNIMSKNWLLSILTAKVVVVWPVANLINNLHS